jgi:hypothetical protein
MTLTAKQITQKKQTQQILTQQREFKMSRLGLYHPRAWYNAENVVKDGSNLVSQMNDLSGNNYHLQQPIAAKQPLWTDNQLNGKPVISFDGIDDFLSTSFNDILPQPNTIFILYNLNSLISEVAGIYDGNDENYHHTLEATSDKLLISASDENHWKYYSKSSPFDYQINAIIYNDQNSLMYENGIMKELSTGFSGEINDSLSGLEVGRRNRTSFMYANTNIAELIFYDRLVNSRERQYIENYLMNKYAL